MHLVSAFSLVLLGLFGVLIGYFIGNFVKGKQTQQLGKDHKALEQDHQKVHKALNSSKKDVNKTQKQVTLWKDRFETLKVETETLESKHQAETTNLTQQITELTASKRSLSADLQFAKSNQDKLNKQYDNLNARYKVELKELKEWKSGKDKFDREMRHLESQAKAADERSKRLQNELAKIQHELNESRSFMTNLKVLKAQNGKLSKDLKYWEQKHYDTNHELANARKAIEAFDSEKAVLAKANAEAAETIVAMEGKVQDFKNKFVELNDKYHKLVNKTQYA